MNPEGEFQLNQTLPLTPWPINSNFPEAFSFPACGTVDWLVLTLWGKFKGVAVSTPFKPSWRRIWGDVCVDNYQGSVCRSRERMFTVIRRDTVMKPDEWVETLLDADKFWKDINGWAFDCVQDEFRIQNPDRAHIFTYSSVSDGTKQCEQFCRRFHAYQQARYRYHQYLLEKRCERALGEDAPGTPQGDLPQTTEEARAALIGWLSKQWEYHKHRLVMKLSRECKRKRRPLSLAVKKAYHAERDHPSGRQVRTDLNENCWLILTWPIWNNLDWRWVELSYALRRRFRKKDRKGEPLDFLVSNRAQMQKGLKSKGDPIPIEEIYDLWVKYLATETSSEREWRQSERKQSDDKAIEQQCRRVVKWLEILPRPKGRPPEWSEDEKLQLWVLAYRITA